MSKKDLFKQFIEFFEEVPPPIVINEETISNIRNAVKPLPQQMLSDIVSRWEGELDEFTEIIPCFSLPPTNEYRTVVYWKASLLKYEYVIITIGNDNTMISRKVLCDTQYEGEIVKKSVAKIDEDRIIHISAGATLDNKEFNPDHTHSYSIEMLESGDMLFHIDTDQNP